MSEGRRQVFKRGIRDPAQRIVRMYGSGGGHVHGDQDGDDQRGIGRWGWKQQEEGLGRTQSGHRAGQHGAPGDHWHKRVIFKIEVNGGGGNIGGRVLRDDCMTKKRGREGRGRARAAPDVCSFKSSVAWPSMAIPSTPIARPLPFREARAQMKRGGPSSWTSGHLGPETWYLLRIPEAVNLLLRFPRWKTHKAHAPQSNRLRLSSAPILLSSYITVSCAWVNAR